jgi:hypothetical protein
MDKWQQSLGIILFVKYVVQWIFGPKSYSPNPAPKRVGFDLFSSLGQKWCGGGGGHSLCPWSTSSVFCAYLPCVYNTLLIHIRISENDNGTSWCDDINSSNASNTTITDKEVFHLCIISYQYSCIWVGDALVIHSATLGMVVAWRWATDISWKEQQPPQTLKFLCSTVT